ncbi:MAG: N-formylglutamate amidohydrolase [Bacteriovoracaceae bacterium]
MFSLDHPLKTPLFELHTPKSDIYRGLISIPHSGEDIPEVFEKFLSGNEFAYKSDVDFKVNELVNIEELQKAGIAVLVAHVHRICVDLNRSEENCVLFWKENTQGEPLVIRNPNPEEIQTFIETYHRPYFEVLKSALKDLERKKKNLVSMIDLHSMPSRPTEYHMKQNPNQKQTRPDFCLSDRRGKTCAPEFIDYFQKLFASNGFDASINDPYIGGYVTEYVDRFRTNNIQIEINRSIYMDEKLKILVPEKVASLRPALTNILINGFEKFDS